MNSRPARPAPESAAAQVSMLREMVRQAPADEEGMVRVHRGALFEALSRIEEDHRQELQAVPTIAGRMLAVFGVSV